MSNNELLTIIASGPSTESLIAAYYSLVLIIVGTLLNSITFIILCRPIFRDTRARPTFHYIRAIAILDILMLYGWNLDHYVSIVYQFRIMHYSIISCRLISFLSYFSAQSSAWLRVFVCLDRYLSLSRLHRTWFGQSKNVLIIIACIMSVLLLLNFHFFLFVCYYRNDGTISAQSLLYNIYPLWDYVNLGVYNCAPFILMVIFNSGAIYHLIRLNRTRIIQNSRIAHRAISITLITTTSLFLVMTVPASVAFAFFFSSNINLLRFLDSLLYSYYILSFPTYFIILDEFRQEFITIITCKKNNRRVAPPALH